MALRRLLLAAALATLGTTAQAADERAPSAQRIGRGRALAQAHCAYCHAVGETGDSPNRLAPPFRRLGRSVPVADAISALAEGAQPMHPAMPRFRLDLDQSRDLVAYVLSVQE